MATKTSNRVKLPVPYKYRHTWLAAPTDDYPFPFQLFSVNSPQPVIPNKETDSHKLTHGNEGIVMGYSPRQEADSFEFEGWRFLAITSDQVYHPPQGDVMGSLWSVFSGVKQNGEKWDSKYRHFAVAVPRNKYAEFPVDMLRYDRAFLFNNDDAELVDLRRSHRNMDDAAIARYAAKRQFDGICVVKHTETISEKVWTPDRWRSFGWELQEPTSPYWME